MKKQAIKYAGMCRNTQTHMQEYAKIYAEICKIRTVLAKHAEICTKYAQNMQ